MKQFWKKWMHLMFQEKLLSRTWRKVKRNVAVGDVVYMMEKDDDDEFCRMGVVEEVKTGPEGCIRTAIVRYTNPGETRIIVRRPSWQFAPFTSWR